MAAPESKREFRILGPFEARENGRRLAIGAGKQRALVTLLLLNAGEVVATEQLIDALWGENPPASALNSVHIYVSQLRKVLGEGCLITRGRGYLLALEPEQLDLGCFERLLAEGRELLAKGEAASASEAMRSALALWRGPPLGDFASEPFAQGEIARLEELRLAALEERIEADLALGRDAELVPELEALVRANPLRERLQAQLMLALYRSGRQAEALETYRRARVTLVAELGLEPGRRLQELERAILRQDPRLDPSTRAASRLRRGGLLIVIGAALLLAAAIAVVVIELTHGGSPGLRSAAANAVALVEADTNRIVADVPVRNGPTSVAVGDGAVWVTNAQDDSVSRIDPRTRSVIDHIRVGSAPSGIATGAGAVWVANSLDDTVSRIDPQTNTVVQPIPVGATPTAVAFGGGAVWVTSTEARSLTKIDAGSGRVIERFPTGAIGRGIALGGGGIWVTDEASGSVVRVDPESGSVVRPVNVGNGPTGIAFGYGSVWVANSLDGTVSRIDPQSNTVTATISVGEGPDGIAVGPRGVWVSVEFSQEVARIDPAENQVVERIPVGNRPKGLALSGNEVWFAVQPSGTGHRGGRLVVAPLSFGSIDPLGGLPPPLLSTLYDGLLGTARRGGSEGTRIVPNLAASLPVVTTGGTRYTFQLRHGIRYSSGALVKASDFRRAFERLFRARAGQAFLSLVGGDVCERRPRRCDLSQGVLTDDATGTVVFHLRRPDGEFLFNLVGGPPPVPAGTPDRVVGTRPVPSTGPYTIKSFVPGRTLKLVRNPHFRVWSKTARPDGYPDEIEFKLLLSAQSGVTGSAVTAVERGQVDVAMGVPADRLQELETRYASQLHLNPLAQTVFIFLNTTLPPFDDVRVRRAVNYAVDRAAVARAQGGSQAARPTCQLRPPSVAGYRPYCPFTIDPNPAGEWKAPDLQRARRLVAASGTVGMKVTVWTMPSRAPATREVVAALKRLGYRARVRVEAIDYFPKVLAKKTSAQAGMFGWIGGPGSPPSSFLPMLTCGSILPESQNRNPSFFCNRRIDTHIQRALRVQATDPDAAVPLWVRIERELVDQAPWVPLYTPRWAEFVSKRVGNYQGAGLLDQLWVR